MVKQRLFKFDFIRSFAIIAVIALHSDQITLSHTNYVGGKTWWMIVILDSIFKTSVPLFVMLSGALMYKRLIKLKYKDVIKRVWNRLFFPLMVWTVVYFWWRAYWQGEIFTINQIITRILTGDIYHLYYLIIVIGLYLATPIFARFKIFEKNTLGLLFIIAAFIRMTNYFVLDQATLNSFLLLFVPFIPYFLAGDKLSKKNIDLKLAASLFLISSLANTYLFYLTTNQLVAGFSKFWTSKEAYYFWDATSPLIIASTLSVWVILQHISPVLEKQKYVKQIVTWIAKLSLPMYLIHPIVLDLLDHYGNFAIHQAKSQLYINYEEKVFLTLTITLIASYLLTLIPILNLTVGGGRKKN